MSSQDGGADGYAHPSEIEMDGFRTLSEGERVEFKDRDSHPRGPKAVNARRVEQTAADLGPTDGHDPGRRARCPAPRSLSRPAPPVGVTPSW